MHPSTPAAASPPSQARSPSRDHSPAPFRMPSSAADITPAAYGARTARVHTTAADRIAPHSPSSGSGGGSRTPRSSRAHPAASPRGRDAAASSSHGLAPSAAAVSVAAAVGVPALAATGGLSQRMRTHGQGYATPGSPSNVSGYSYSSKARSTPAAALSPAAASVVSMPRTSVYATSRSSNHPSALLSTIAPPPPPPVNYSAEGGFHLSGSQSLHPATLASFSQAVLPPNASTSYAHFASHPITFATSPSNAAGQANHHAQRMALASAASATALFDHSQTFVTNYNASPSISLAPLLPPLGQRTASRDGAHHTFPHSQPVTVQKHDRASQTSPRLMPQPAPAASLPAAATSLLAPPVSAAPALAPGASTFGAGVTVPNPTRRPGYEFTHARLLEYHEVLADIGGAVSEEDDGGPTRELSYPLSFPDPLQSPGDPLVGFYHSISHWEDFDIFSLYNATNGWPLSFAFMMIDRKHNFLSQVGVDPVTAFHFIQEVESNYLPNPYHTATHAADVLHAAFHLVEHTPLLKSGLSALDCFVLYISCAVHDFQHPGINNSFLVNSRAPLALRYNDRSVLESFHISGAFRMMSAQPRCNILASFTFPMYTKIRKQLIDLVLSTDLAVHFELMGVFKRKLAAAPPAAAATAGAPTPSPVPVAAAPPAPGSLDLARSEEDRLMLMQIILKCGDLSHPARSRRLHLKWSELVTEEFFQQGDREKLLKLPPSMFMDRETTNLAQSQIGFITFLVYPMFQVYAAFSARDYWSKKVELNLEWWHEVARQEGEEKKREAQAALAAASTAASSTEERSSDADADAEADTEDLSESGNAAGSSTVRSGFVSEPNSAVSRTSSRRASVDSAAGGRRDLSPPVSTTALLSSIPAAAVDKSEEKSNDAAATAPKSRSSSRHNSGGAATGTKPTVSFSVETAPAAAPAPSTADPVAVSSAAPKSASSLTPHSAPILTAPAASPRRGSSNPAAADSTTPARVRKSNRRSITESSLSDNLAILSETAQIAALSAAGASAVEAKEHQAEDAEAAQAQAAAVAASRTHSTSSLSSLSSASSPAVVSKNLHLSLSLSANKRRSVMTGVAPPASPLVLSRQATVTNEANGGQTQLASGTRTIGLSERRATALEVASPATQGPTPSALSPPVLSVSSARGSMLFAPSANASAAATANSSPATAPILESGSSIDFSALPSLDASSATAAAAAPALSVPLSHQAELEASHGDIYLEVRQLASITAVDLEVTALTAPPSPSGAEAVPAFSKRAHALLNTPARKNDAR